MGYEASGHGDRAPARLLSGFPLELMVKQYVTVLRSPTTGIRFQVFKTGDEKYYLFDPLDDHGCSTCLQFPVLKADLKIQYRRALAHGYGNSL